MKNYIVSHRVVFAVSGVIIALAIAYVYYFVVPPESSENRVLQSILVYGHSICWLFLAAASLTWGFNSHRNWYTFFAYAALAIYVVFIGAFILNKVL